VDLARFREGLLEEKAIRRKYRCLGKFGSDDELVRKVEEESVRRMRDGSCKQEKSQLLVTKAPDVLSGILLDNTANARHRIDSAKTLNDFASTGAEAAAAGTQFVIQINMGSDVLKFDKSFLTDPHDIDPNHIDDTPVIAAIATKKRDGGDGEPLRKVGSETTATDRRADQTIAQERRSKNPPSGRSGERTCAGNPR
jgi:hypothetical protein